MIQIDISTTLAKPLARHLKPAKVTNANFVWRAEMAMIGPEVCVVAQERYTQYVLVMCGLTKPEFAQFPHLFCDRFLREAMALCKQAKIYDNKTLNHKLSVLCASPHIQLDPEPVEDGKILTVTETLERQFLYEEQPLPTTGRAAFEFGFKLNNRKVKPGANAKFNAAQSMVNLCLNLLADIPDPQPAIPEIVATEENIVRVDFARNRK